MQKLSVYSPAAASAASRMDVKLFATATAEPTQQILHLMLHPLDGGLLAPDLLVQLQDRNV